MKVFFEGDQGSFAWELPPEATAALEAVPAEAREKILSAFGNNIGVFCKALLRAFGNQAKVETLNMIMQEIQEVVVKP